MKILTILGTRPEVIKLAPIIFAARHVFPEVEMAVCATGQQREMLQQALVQFSLTPDFSLSVMTEKQTLAGLTEKLMGALSATITEYQPDCVLVQGDTTSAFVGGLAAFYQKINVGHVEAGLRTYDLHSPFPEELNRQFLSRIATYHFAPTQLAATNLQREGILAEKIHVTGNTVVDAVDFISARWQKNQPMLPEKLIPLLANNVNKIILVTCHRRESFGEPLLNICLALRALCEKYFAYHFIFPVHLNPHVREMVFQQLKNIKNLHLTDPLDYEATLYILSHADLVLTDSGGIQEEAPSFSVPVVVMRNHTERQEGIKAKVAVLAGTAPEAIIAAATTYLATNTTEKLAANPYGDGKASLRILQTLLQKPYEAFYG